MNRIMIVGAPGSGKSTLARKIGEATGLPVFHMDHIHWKSGWIERSRSDKINLAQEIEARESWIFEGGLSSTFDTRAERAELIIWLDFHILLRLWSVFARTVRSFGKTRPDLPDGCPEKFSLEFYHFIIRTNGRSRARIKKLLAEFSDTPSQRFSSVAAIDRWLEIVNRQGLSAS